ncbi:MAG: hypothetical protein NZM07_10195 [Elioraea sp.]|nr:hypothetical protein [Elioraea sp.]
MTRDVLCDLLRRAGIELARVPPGEEGWITFFCPFPHLHRDLSGEVHWRRERHPSAGARFSLAGGVSGWHCFACKRRGTVAQLFRAMARELGTPTEALALQAEQAERVARVDDRVRGPWTCDPPPRPLDAAHEDLFDPLSAEARAYVARRGCDPERLVAFLGLAWDPEQRRVVFPVRDREGRLYGYTGRAIDPDARPRIRDYYGLPKKHLLLGEHLWRPDRPIFLVEGLFGLARLISIGAEGYANVGAVLGSVLTPEKADRLASWDLPVFFAFDPDAGGDAGLFGPLRPDGTRDARRSALATARAFGLTVHVPAWPDGVDDPDRLELEQVLTMLAAPPYDLAAFALGEGGFAV